MYKRQVDGLDAEIAERGRGFLSAQVLKFEIGVIKTVHEEVDQVRADRLGAFLFQQLCPVSYTHLDVYKRQGMPTAIQTIL